MLRVEMLSTGEEVLHGQIVDSNAAWLASYLFDQGLPMTSRETVGDSLDELVNVMKERSHIADVLIVNGGLGPTTDDLSAQAAAMACGVELTEDAGWIATMQAFFNERGRPMAESNRKQAQIPANAELLDNPVGTACGFSVRLNRCQIFFTPGVPSEFKVMVEQQIVPRLQKQFPALEAPLCLRLTTFGRGESDLATELDKIEMPEGVVMGYRSSSPIIELKVTGPRSQEVAMHRIFERVREVAGESTIFEGFGSLPDRLAERLLTQNLRLAVSESYTGGLLNWRLQSAGVPLANGELQPQDDEASPEKSLENLLARAQTLAETSGAQLALAVGALSGDKLSLALHTPSGTSGLTIRYTATRHGLTLRQETIAMVGMDMLRRYLNGWDPVAEYPWLDRVEKV
ncbi:nicotinamide mononucleotide deamidase-related protein YfaY [Rahnella inusitata]|uniref:CinA-like protein n=1 Tax=Rahnella inusitata TaxID=58169 RepID=A0ABX9P7R9_9GAMM|nr:nicotinamide mononucleotide deamidase-related protein YfaY [Rahnella inusitata]QUT16789.1 nicotinamide mononucleotide deamidase-related protein YfaY [Rahnella inusitata]RJT15763.1 nicotinamide mononucleotide deamidase-related protein YfaY [Rahnella inusitata]